MVTAMDYDTEWREQMRGFDHANDAAAYWNKRAISYDSIWRTSTYAQELLHRMELSAEYTVLDIACGTGVMAIPLAKKVSHVTALDISPLMLDRVKMRVNTEDISNVSFINRDWNQVVIGRDVSVHDVALISRSLPNITLSATLDKINQAVRSGCYITWRAERFDTYEAEYREAIGKRQRVHPDYRIIVGMLDNMGISARVEIFQAHNEENFPTLEAAVLNMAKSDEINQRQFENLMTVAKKRLKLRDGYYTSKSTINWALISWLK